MLPGRHLEETTARRTHGRGEMRGQNSLEVRRSLATSAASVAARSAINVANQAGACAGVVVRDHIPQFKEDF